MSILISGIESESIVDGPGFRLAIYTQGCPHHCPNCHNPQTHPFEGGTPMQAQEIIDLAKQSPLHKGITLSGGEPFCQAKELIELAKLAKAENYNIWIYSGYLFEDLLNVNNAPSDNKKLQMLDTQATYELLSLCDVLVDGPFLEEQKSYDLDFKGSSNQRLIDLPKSLQANQCILLET
ncbi:MAG: anaerobic ribonucleoside-triphosphate reductase activating protein [Coriobacteriales bacterium]|nr:anaerobic ribonucleoside-triphosphate reductase activating protein [Coriobacteriales bacterium]